MEMIRKYGLLWGKWKPAERLGGGSFGSVYRICDQLRLQKDCAVKLIRVTNIDLEISPDETMSSEAIKDMQTRAIRKKLREIRLMDQLNSAPNIVTIHDSSIQYGSDLRTVDILLRMELLTSLTARIKKQPLSRMEIITLGIDICSALASCERYGIVHFDIKPDNILIDEDGHYKLGDFGLSKSLNEGSTGSMADRKGTLNYMSPEAWHLVQRSTHRSDQYSLGIVLYQLLNNGNIPFCRDMSDAQMRIDAINQRLEGTPLPPPANDAGELWKIIQRACAYREADRYPNAVEMRKALRALVNKERSEGASTFIRLSDYVKQHPIEPDCAAQIGLSLCCELTELEKEKKIHCEISPDRILINEAMDCCLLPPKAFCHESDIKERRRSRDVSIYMAPEGLIRGKKVSYQTDQYALGMVLYQLLNRGKLPFCEDASNLDLVEDAVYQILDGEKLPRPVDAGDAIWQIIQKACALQESERYASAAQMQQALQDLNHSIQPESKAVLMVQQNHDKENPNHQLFSLFPAKDIKAVIFKDTLADAPNTASDLSEKQDCTVLGWMENGTLYLAGNGGVTANKDSSFLFYRCTELERIEFNHCFDTSNVTDMEGMFEKCSLLTSLDVSNFDTSNVTSMEAMFNRCGALLSLDVSGFNTSNVTDMKWMFANCSSLTFLDISRFDTSNVTNMRCMFYNCSLLTSLDVSRFDTYNVTDMKWMFAKCSSLTSLDVSRFDTYNVTNMGVMFGECSSLTSLDVSRFDTSNVTNMAWMFNECGVLSSLDVSRFNTSNVTNMRGMFQLCSLLTSLDVSRFDTSNVTDMGWMFYNCSSLTSLDVSRFDTSNVTNMRCMFYNCSLLISLDVSGFDTSNVTDTEYMFYGCPNRRSLEKTINSKRNA